MRRIATIACILSLSAATLAADEPKHLSVDTIHSTQSSSFQLAGFTIQTSDNNQSHGLHSSDLIVVKPGNNSDFSLRIGFDGSPSSLNQMKITPSIAWSPHPDITFGIGSEHQLDTFDEMSLTIGTAFAF